MEAKPSTDISRTVPFELPKIPSTNTTALPDISSVEDHETFDSHFKGHSKNDQRDMDRMGKHQAFNRNFKLLSTLSFALMLQATWEFTLISHTQGLKNGGIAGLFWSYVWTFIGFGFVVFSIAEMASMAPISGGQYHWVSEFASPNQQKFLSYVTGWMSVLAWQAGAASSSFLAGSLIQGILALNCPVYYPSDWRGALLVIAVILLIYVSNVWMAQGLPALQIFLLILHVIGFLAVVIVLWTLAPRNSVEKIFADFSNLGGWPSMGLCLMVGQISALYGSLSPDATAHMAEEITDAARNVPLAIARGYLVNVTLSLILMATYLFALTSVEDALNDPTGFPFIYVFRNTVSIGGLNALTALILVLVIGSTISLNASASRQLFAFARDKGLPFSRWLSAVHKSKCIPVNAIKTTCLLSAAVSLINLLSNVAFKAIVSLYVAALMFTYTISIACVLYCRLFYPGSLPSARWSLGKRKGIAINTIGLLYAAFAIFWSLWPIETPVTLKTFNWNVLVFSGVALLSMVMYVVHGQRVYSGPAISVF